MINGRVVDCAELGKNMKGFLGFGIGVVAFLFVLGILCAIFWVWMLVHAVASDIKDKPLWIILILFTGLIGAVVYYFAVKRHYVKAPAAPTQTSTPTPSQTQASQQ
jgi:hypothetical protein